MKCSDLQFNLTLYADGSLNEVETASVTIHLDICPLCRQMAADYREISSDLRHLRRPEMSAALRSSLKGAVSEQVRLEKRSIVPLPSDIREWLQMQVMPYGIGVFASVLVGVTFLTMMFSGMLKPGPASTAKSGNDSSIMLASSRSPFGENDLSIIPPSEYAQSRMAFANESPSVNTQGALIALTRSLIRGGMKDAEVVVVADVFSNGVARITEVVEPSRDAEAINELEKAFRSGYDNSPFVPSSLENRPENMTIVLKIQTVDVNISSKRLRRRS